MGTVRIVGASLHPDAQTVSTLQMARAVERAECERGREMDARGMSREARTE